MTEPMDARQASCPHCGAANRGDARFCGVCGQAVSATEPTEPRAPGEPPNLIGKVIAGRYRILTKLGEGGMGAVFRAEQISLKRTVAVKLLRPDIAGNPLLLRRFNAEAELVAKLNHPNTVNIYDFGQDTDGTLFIAMELIEGKSLRAVLQAEAPLPPRRALAIAMQVASSLADAHARSIVHRDLKPDNVMLQDRGRERDVVRVLDFGIAKLRDDSRATQAMTQQGDMLGTPQYMSPEQIRAEAIDGRTDVYALGCMLYVMVTGRLPHEAPTVLALLSKHLMEHPVPPSQRRPDLGLSPAIDRLILEAMAKDAAARPATMEMFGERIAALLAEQPADPRSAVRSAVAPPGPNLASDTPMAFSMAPGMAPGTSGPGQPSAVAASVTPAPPLVVPAPMVPMSGYPMAPGVQGGPYGANAPYGHAVMPAAMMRPMPPGYVQPARSYATLIIIAGAVAASVLVGVLLVVAGRSADSTKDESADLVHAKPGSASLSDHDDPWASSTPLSGTTVSVGQGVQLVLPPAFGAPQGQGGFIVARDGRGVFIVTGPAGSSDDPQQIATAYARATNTTIDGSNEIFVGGIKRPMSFFHGPFKGTPYSYIAVPLIGPNYRVVVSVAFPSKLAGDKAVQGELLELYTRRIILP